MSKKYVRNVSEAIEHLIALAKSVPQIPVPEAFSGMDARRTNILKQLQTNFSDYKSMIEIVSILDNFDYSVAIDPSGKKIPEDPYFQYGAIVVPLSNPNSHNYTIGCPYMARGKTASLASVAWIYGNNITDTEGTIRSATPEEIDAFFTVLMVSESLKQKLVFDALDNGVIEFGCAPEAAA